MPFIGNKPTAIPLTSSDLEDGIITSAKLAAGVGGKVLQVVTGTTTTAVSQTANSYVSGGLTATITPSSTSNKILIITSCRIRFTGDGSSSSGRSAYVGLFRGTVSDTKIYENYGGISARTADTSTNPTSYMTVGFSFLDSPATSSAQTYTVGIKGDGACDLSISGGSELSTITLLEVSA